MEKVVEKKSPKQGKIINNNKQKSYSKSPERSNMKINNYSSHQNESKKSPERNGLSTSQSSLNKSQSKSKSPMKNGKKKEKSNEQSKKIIINLNNVNPENPIPEQVKKRFLFLKNVLTNEPLQRHLSGAPDRIKSNIEEMAKYFVSYSKNEIEIFALIYLWICNNVSYDTKSFFSKVTPDGSAEHVFQTGLSVCEGYANLFQALCTTAGLQAEKVSGYAKGYGYKPEQSCAKSNHAWNTINCYGSWYIIDCTWGAGYLNEEKKFEKKFNPFYFLTPPELIITSHHPENDKWQLLKKPKTLQQFETQEKIDYSGFFRTIFEKNIELITHSVPVIIHRENDFNLKLGYKNMTVISKLSLNKVEIKKGITQNYDITGTLTIDIHFEKIGEYELVLFEKVSDKISDDGSGKNEVYSSILTFFIKVIITTPRKGLFEALASPINYKRKNQTNIQNFSSTNASESYNKLKMDTLISSSKPKCFDNSNAYLYEPKSNYLKIGASVKFRVKVKGATSVVVLDHKQFNYLKKKSDDIWEGLVTIQSDLVSICAQKSSSLFTEVFEFNNIK